MYFIVVTYDKVDLFGNPLPGYFTPGDYYTFDNFEDAMHCLDLNILSGHECEIWMWDRRYQWNRIRFQSGVTEPIPFVH